MASTYRAVASEPVASDSSNASVDRLFVSADVSTDAGEDKDSSKASVNVDKMELKKNWIIQGLGMTSYRARGIIS